MLQIVEARLKLWMMLQQKHEHLVDSRYRKQVLPEALPPGGIWRIHSCREGLNRGHLGLEPSFGAVSDGEDDFDVGVC